jgi:hypothetical protein
MFTTPPSRETRRFPDQPVKTVCNDPDKSVATDQLSSNTPVYQSPYGHACCPHCIAVFDLNAATPTFLEKAPHNDIIVYIMCPECHAAFQAGGADRKSMSDKCFINFKLTGIDSDGDVYPWAITTMLTMEFNDFDPVAAIENGHGLTREQYFGICSGTHEYFVFSDCIFLLTKSTSSGVV